MDKNRLPFSSQLTLAKKILEENDKFIDIPIVKGDTKTNMYLQVLKEKFDRGEPVITLDVEASDTELRKKLMEQFGGKFRTIITKDSKRK